MKNVNNQKSCCQKGEKEKNGFLSGLFYGILPHTFCLLFIILSVSGATTATALLKPFLLNHYFFYILIALSFLFATISAIFYLKRNGILSFSGIKRKLKYLSVLYATTISVNLILFMLIFPIAANLNSSQNQKSAKNSLFELTLKVNIPCPGHASLITSELKKIDGVENVLFQFPNLFKVSYDPKKPQNKRYFLYKFLKHTKLTF